MRWLSSIKFVLVSLNALKHLILFISQVIFYTYKIALKEVRGFKRGGVALYSEKSNY